MINSALWDVNRWGPNGIKEFKENIVSQLCLLVRLLPPYTQVKNIINDF